MGLFASLQHLRSCSKRATAASPRFVAWVSHCPSNLAVQAVPCRPATIHRYPTPSSINLLHSTNPHDATPTNALAIANHRTNISYIHIPHRHVPPHVFVAPSPPTQPTFHRHPTHFPPTQPIFHRTTPTPSPLPHHPQLPWPARCARVVAHTSLILTPLTPCAHPYLPHISLVTPMTWSNMCDITSRNQNRPPQRTTLQYKSFLH